VLVSGGDRQREGFVEQWFVLVGRCRLDGDDVEVMRKNEMAGRKNERSERQQKDAQTTEADLFSLGERHRATIDSS
jgi:hypothetical protein